jgi:hypothetical protein
MANLPPKTGITDIDNLNLRDIVAAVRKRRRWSAHTAQEADRWYRLFLAMSQKKGGTAEFGIYPGSDYIWHEHITFTKRYRADCEKLFGKFLDHTPERPKSWRAMLKTSAAEYDAAYGVHPPDVFTCCI